MYSLGWPGLVYLRPSITSRHQSSYDKSVRACKRACVHLPVCDWVAGDTVRPWTYSQKCQAGCSRFMGNLRGGGWAKV